jgi:hypothetical protein
VVFYKNKKLIFMLDGCLESAAVDNGFSFSISAKPVDYPNVW